MAITVEEIKELIKSKIGTYEMLISVSVTPVARALEPTYHEFVILLKQIEEKEQEK